MIILHAVRYAAFKCKLHNIGAAGTYTCYRVSKLADRQKGPTVKLRWNYGMCCFISLKYKLNKHYHLSLSPTPSLQCPPPIMSPTPGSSRSIFAVTPSNPARQPPRDNRQQGSSGNKPSLAPVGQDPHPPSPTASKQGRGSHLVAQPASSSEDDEGNAEEQDDLDLPLDLGNRTWTKTLTKGERVKRGYRSKTAVLSIQ